MWKWIFVVIVVFFIFVAISGRRTGEANEYQLMGSLMLEQLPMSLQEELKKFCHEPEDLTGEFPIIPDHYIIGEKETMILETKYPDKYKELVDKNLVLTLDFNSGPIFKTAYTSSVQSQDKCGSCWAFACASALTTRIRLYSRRGKSNKYFCYQGSKTNPPECSLSQECANLGNSIFQKLRSSEWVEIITGGRKTSSYRKVGNSCIPYIQYSSNNLCYDYPSCPPNKRRIYNKMEGNNILTGFECVDINSSSSTFPFSRGEEKPVVIVDELKSELPDLFVEPMLWFNVPDENSNAELLKLDKITPGQTGWIYDCLSPYFLAGCNITEIAWELDPTVLGSIQQDLNIKINDINKQMTSFIKSEQLALLSKMNNICFGGIPLYACIYLMLQGCTSLKSHNPFKRFENYKKCLEVVRTKGEGYEKCKKIVNAFSQSYPSNREIESRLRLLYGCQDCDANALPFYSSNEDCFVETEQGIKSLYDQYFCCKRVYIFNKPGLPLKKIIENIKRDIMKYGAVVICIDIKTDLNYNGSDKRERIRYYNRPYIAAGRPACDDGICGHAIIAIGWTKTVYGNAWICKNSWGENWGNKGHFLLAEDKFISDVVAMEPFKYYDPEDFIIPTSIQQQIKKMTIKDTPSS